jgi:hypothetical protein
LDPRGSTRIKSAAKALITVNENTNEAKIARITLVAIEPTNSPAGPGISAIGAKANAVGLQFVRDRIHAERRQSALGDHRPR